MKKKLSLLITLLVLFLFSSFSVMAVNKVLKPTSASNEALEIFEKARAEIAVENNEEALKLLNQAIELDKGFSLAYIYRILVDGSINSYRHNVEKALENMDAASADEQELLKLFKYDLEKQGDKIKEQIASVQKSFPDDVWVNYILGYFNFNGVGEEARQFLAKTIELDHNFIPGLTGLIVNLTYAMKLDEAKKYAEKYIKMKPGDADPYLKMGTIYRQQNELEKAREYYEKAIEIDPEDKLGTILLANCHVFLGNYKQAHELYEKSYEQRTQPVYKRTVLSNMAIARVFEGNKEKAIEAFDRIRQYNIENGDIAATVYNRFNQAFVAIIFGDFALADTYMLKAKKEAESNEITENQKENIDENFMLWTSYFECLKGNTDKATELADNYMNIAEEQNVEYKIKWAHLFHGIIAVKKGEYGKAIEYFKKGPEDYLLWYYQGIAYQELGNTEKAVEQFSKVGTANLINMNLASVKKDAVKRLKVLSNN